MFAAGPRLQTMGWRRGNPHGSGGPRVADSLDFIAYARIKNMIVSGELPPGQLLSENELAGEFGVSRTPVHTAIARLVEEGLVEALPKRGFIVREPTLAEFFDMHETIASMEFYALERLKSDPTRLDISMLREQFERQTRARNAGDYMEYYLSGFDFAETILRSFGNVAMQAVLRSFKAKLLCKVINYRKSRPDQKPGLTLRGHGAVLEAIERGDFAAAQNETLKSLEHVLDLINTLAIPARVAR